MYLHIGLNYMIKKKYIVGIFDIETTTGSSITKMFLSKAQKNSCIISVTNELPRSYILYKEGKNTKVYLTQLSSATLQKRNLQNENFSVL